jgi:hypothetical protein
MIYRLQIHGNLMGKICTFKICSITGFSKILASKGIGGRITTIMDSGVEN